MSSPAACVYMQQVWVGVGFWSNGPSCAKAQSAQVGVAVKLSGVRTQLMCSEEATKFRANFCFGLLKFVLHCLLCRTWKSED